MASNKNAAALEQGAARKHKAIDASNSTHVHRAAQTTFADFGIVIPAIHGGEWRTLCPQCSHTRKKNSDRCLSVNVTEGVWYCHHCGWKGGLSDKSPADLRRIESRRVQQGEIDLALIVTELARAERARGVVHSESDLTTIQCAVTLLKSVPPSRRKLSEPKLCKDLRLAIDQAFREGHDHIEFGDLCSLCDRCGNPYLVRDGGWLCAICADEVANGG